MKKSIFRAEALAAQHDDRLGQALLTQPLSVRALVLAAVVAAGGLVAFVTCGEYTRKEHVAGVLQPSAGLIKVYAPSSGQVVRKVVVEGQAVRHGDTLLVLSTERSSAAITDSQAAMQQAVQARRDSLRLELSKQAEIGGLESAAMSQRLRGLEAQHMQALAQADLQRSRVSNAQRKLERERALVAEGFLSKARLQETEDELTAQQAQLSALSRNVTALASDMNSARSELAAAAPKQANLTAAITRQISELDQQLIEADSRRTIVLTAPADGTVTTILAELGQTLSPSAPVLSILPAGAQLEAQLYVPTRSAGFIQPGQTVALRYQAFPYQRFGHAVGEVISIGRSAIHPNEGSVGGTVEGAYRITVRLPAQSVKAYGKAMPLQAGMALDADIWVDRRRIVEWIFDPLFSIAGRV